MEPLLKYSKLLEPSSNSSINSVSSLSVSSRFICYGTCGGDVVLTDVIGTPIKKWSELKAADVALDDLTIASISFDYTEEFMISSTLNGQVSVYNLFNGDVVKYSLKQSINSIKIDPNYSRTTTRQFVVGGNNSCVLFGKGWFGLTNTVLESGEKIDQVDWRNNYVTWTSRLGTTIYDVVKSTKLGFIENDHHVLMDPVGEVESAALTYYHSLSRWSSDSTLLLSYGDTVKIVELQQLTTGVLNLVAKYKFKMDFLINGIAPFEHDKLFLLGYGNGDILPEIHLVDSDGKIIGNDAIQSNLVSSNCKLGNLHFYKNFKMQNQRLIGFITYTPEMRSS
jgi:hypothetical protein